MVIFILFFFRLEFFWLISPKNSKYFEYSRLFWICKILGWFYFSILELLASFVQKFHLVFGCCLINLPAVYSQIFEASGFFKWDSFYPRLNIHCKVWSYNKKKHKKIKAYRKSLYKEPTVNRCLLILDLKLFRS